MSFDILCSRFQRIPVNFIRQALVSRNSLFAPTFIYLHTLLPTDYNPIKTSRGTNHRAEAELQAPEGAEVAAEMEWIQSWLEGRLSEEEAKRRKKQEEDDAEAARQLNYQEHQAKGGLLEWCFRLNLLLIVVVVVLMNIPRIV